MIAMEPLLDRLGAKRATANTAFLMSGDRKRVLRADEETS